ncbi:hypothetical protein [Micromonospora cathayae]|uniref:Thiazolylpeptide-type bacteriocin n=1 Tax=Micromonospora cathayae TaxID=3028804 RepID=A0ABY7ZPJ9_9ACTN|nr:hypothetical protein [Micromonospora sp. HUAS 3]WDZ84147.1 hypothetical protein PVK37_27395 [Micromonospora sp. HUAS 3]
MPITLNNELRELETETFEIEEIDGGAEDVLAATSSSCSCSSCCSCSTSSCCSTSTSTSSCG